MQKNGGNIGNSENLLTASSQLGAELDTTNAESIIECKRDNTQSFVVALYNGRSNDKLGFKKDDTPARLISDATVRVMRDGSVGFSFTKNDSNYSGKIPMNLNFSLSIDGNKLQDNPNEPCKVTLIKNETKPKPAAPIF